MRNPIASILTIRQYHAENACVLVQKICGEVGHNVRQSAGINRGLSIAAAFKHKHYVGNTAWKPAVKPSFSHTASPAIFAGLPEVVAHLSPLSTPPITTTTKYIY